MSGFVDEITLRRARESFSAYVEPISHLLDDPEITDVMLNAAASHGEPGRVWVDRVGEGLRPTGVTIAASSAESIIRAFANQSSGEHELHARRPQLSCQAAHGQFRFEALIPPAVITPTFVIRKYIVRDVTLADYVQAGELTEKTAECLASLARSGQTLLLGGETGSGKTTMLNALLREAGNDGARRLLIIEDTPELYCPDGPSSRIEVRPGTAFGYREAVVSALRQRPSGIVLGELRFPDDAVEALRAWNTGHQGMGTLHAPSCTGMLWMLYDLCRQSEKGRHVTQQSIANAIHAVVHLHRKNGRRVIDAALVVGWSDSDSEFLLKGT
jgi:Flp pilus assembly CpaF family ATPase